MSDLLGNTILIVEDDEFSREVLRQILLSEKASILTADDGEKAIEVFENNAIDLVLLDLRLPGLSGFEVIKKMKEKKPQIPVIGQSAFAYNNEKEKCINAGFNEFMTKPVDIYRLIECIKKLLNVSKKNS
jgi:CheY-like chemotaxis protein